MTLKSERHIRNDGIHRRRPYNLILWSGIGSGKIARPCFASGEQTMLVISRNGKTTVLTGWRAWLAGCAIFAAATLLFFLIVFVLLGVAITVGTVLLVVVPIGVGLAILASLFRSPNTR
jgi:hypothetical protein